MLSKFGEYRDWPRFTFTLLPLGKLVFKLNRGGKYPGSASVELNRDWLGYVHTNGNFDPSRGARNLEEGDKLAFWQFMTELRKDPEKTFSDNGIETGVCCACGRTLTNPESVDLGIGPVCRERLFG